MKFFIFPTRFECIFTPYFCNTVLGQHLCYTTNDIIQSRAEPTACYNSSGDLHSKRVEKMWNITRNEWRRWETTLETSGEDEKPHPKQVEKIFNYTPNEWRRYLITLQTSGVLKKNTHLWGIPINLLTRTGTQKSTNIIDIFPTRLECSLTSFPPAWSVV